METQVLYEVIGYLGSLLVALSLSMRRILYLRVLNALGSTVFIIYALLIDALPIVVTNLLILAINGYYLYQHLSAKEFFRLLEIAPESDYLRAFLEFYHSDLQSLFQNFRYSPHPDDRVLLVLRDMIPSGVLIGRQEGETFRILLDYVTPAYRDFKVGHFLFHDSQDYFRQQGIQQLSASAHLPIHQRYLERVGFRPLPGGGQHYQLEL